MEDEDNIILLLQDGEAEFTPGYIYFTLKPDLVIAKNLEHIPVPEGKYLLQMPVSRLRSILELYDTKDTT